jgi:hypothetical protein
VRKSYSKYSLLSCDSRGNLAHSCRSIERHDIYLSSIILSREQLALAPHTSSKPRVSAPASTLEDSSDLEEPFLVSGIAETGADKKRAKSGFSDDARRNVVGEFCFGRKVVHLGEFV